MSKVRRINVSSRSMDQTSNLVRSVPGTIHIGVCLPQGPQYDLTRGLIERQDWHVTELDPVEICHKANTWDLLILGTSYIDAEFLGLTVAGARDPQRRVLVMSEDRDPRHIADVLGAGADDYLVVPYAPEECLARIRTLVYRPTQVVDRRKSTPLTFDFEGRSITAGPKRIVLSATEWRILLALLEAEGTPVSASHLSFELSGASQQEKRIPALIHQLRQKLVERQFPAIVIETKRGSGYAAYFRRTGDALPALAGRSQSARGSGTEGT